MPKDDPVFKEEFRNKLAQGKYTDWAVDLDEESLQILLHHVGEYAFRTSFWKPLAELLDTPPSGLPRDPGIMRLVLALKVIQRICWCKGINEEIMKEILLYAENRHFY